MGYSSGGPVNLQYMSIISNDLFSGIKKIP